MKMHVEYIWEKPCKHLSHIFLFSCTEPTKHLNIFKKCFNKQPFQKLTEAYILFKNNYCLYAFHFILTPFCRPSWMEKFFS